MKRFLGLMILLAGVFFSGIELSAGNNQLNCANCGKKIKGQYLSSSDGQIFCSQNCADNKLLPRCANCKKMIRGQYLSTKDGKIFCSQACADAKLLPHCQKCGRACPDGGMIVIGVYGNSFYCKSCFSGPKCFVCDRRANQLRQLNDGRAICAECNATAVSNLYEAQKLFQFVQQKLCDTLGFPKDHSISLRMESVNNAVPGANGESRELGLYIYSAQIMVSTATGEPVADKKAMRKREKGLNYGPMDQRSDEKCSVVVLDFLPRAKLAEVMAHELAHDYMQHRWPYVQETKFKEGFAEFVASEYNRMTGAAGWNRRMENNRDPVYGDGYRMYKQWFKSGGWNGIIRNLDQANYQGMPESLRPKDKKK